MLHNFLNWRKLYVTLQDRCLIMFKNDSQNGDLFLSSGHRKYDDCRLKFFIIQECIPVGCVPPICCPYLPACTAHGGFTCPGGCTCLGVYLARGVYLSGGGGVPAWGYLPRGVPAWGCTCPGDVLACGEGHTCLGGTCLGVYLLGYLSRGSTYLEGVPAWGSGSTCLGGVPAQVLPPSWTEFLTHATENITLPQTSFAGGNN